MSKALLSPCSDFIFKLIFGDSRNADVLTAFLQSILDLPAEEYEKITFVDPHLKPEAVDDKLGILDVKIHTKHGNVIDVEIQVTDDVSMKERFVYYLSKMVVEQIGKGEDYSRIKRAISIIITGFNFIEDSGSYQNSYRLFDRKHHSEFTDLLEMNTLELPKLPTENDDSELWDWMKFLKTKKEEELQMLAMKNPMIGKAVGVLKELSADERTRLIDEQREKALKDKVSALGLAERRGIKKGIEKGIKKGKLEGKLEGMVEVARNLLRLNMPVPTISAATGLSCEEIEKLR